MENKLTKIVAILTVAVLLVAGPVVYAGFDGNDPGNNPGDNPGGDKGPQSGADDKFMEKLNLDAEQREKFKALQESDKAVKEQIKKKTQELEEVVAEPSTTRSDADYLVDDISELEAKVLSQKMDRIFSLKKILTPEQFEEMQKQNKGSMNPSPGGPGGQNPGPNPGDSGQQNQESDPY